MISDAQVGRLEDLVGQFNDELSPLKDFILPGGTRAAAVAHLARTVCRRAERYVVLVPNATSCVWRPANRFPIPRASTSIGCRT